MARRRREPVFAGLNYDPDAAAVLLPVDSPAATPKAETPKRKRGKQEEERGHGEGLVEDIHDHGALLNATDLQRCKFTKGLTEAAMTQLNNSRKQRGMMEAEELGAALFWRIPENHQRRILELIRIMDNASAGHPKVRTKLVRTIVNKFLEAARDSRRPR